MNEIIFFSIFILIVFTMILIDLGLFSREYHAVTLKESATWSLIWIGLAGVFFFFILYFGHLIHGLDTAAEVAKKAAENGHPIDITEFATDRQAVAAYDRSMALQYLAGYLIEYSLSLDNVFVILLIFLSFKVPEEYYKRVLFWGILGAVVMRFIFIFALSALIHRFEWIFIPFAILLIFTAAKMTLEFMRKKKKTIDVENHPVVRWARKIFPVHPGFSEHRFMVKQKGKWYITPLFIVLLVIEFSDVIFAVDSVPAIFAVTRDPYIVFFSNIFAIIGLRSMFFMISHIFGMFRFLKPGLAALLFYIGVKMILPFIPHLNIELSISTSLFIIFGILSASILLSLIFPKEDENRP